MSYCSYCGTAIDSSMKYCPSCGAPLTASTASLQTYTAVTEPAADADYAVVLVSRGTCAESTARDVLEDLLGYSSTDAKAILAAAPTEAAMNLTQVQAKYIAQALTEYGMQVSVWDGGNYVELDNDETAKSSIFDNAGSFLAGAAAVLGTITVANQVKKFFRWTKPAPEEHVYRPRFVVAPPKHKRRSFLDWLFGRKEPKPVVQTVYRKPIQPRNYEPFGRNAVKRQPDSPNAKPRPLGNTHPNAGSFSSRSSHPLGNARSETMKSRNGGKSTQRGGDFRRTR